MVYAQRAWPRYLCTEFYRKALISERVKSVVDVIAEVLAPDDFIGVYPDAMYENWGIPTGLLLATPPERAILFPTFLRDPGCGYLVFQVEFSPHINSNWYHEVGDLLDKFVRDESKHFHQPMAKVRIEDVIWQGLEAVQSKNTLCDYIHFQDIRFDVFVRPGVLTKDERCSLEVNFGTVTNTIELRTIYEVFNSMVLAEWQIDDRNVIGFIHTGCNGFETILEQRFAYQIAERSIEEEIFTLDDIENGIFGIHLKSALGNELHEWIKMAMNYAIVNRYLVYLTIKHLLETRFPCRVNLVRDAVHCGIYQDKTSAIGFCKIFRGVQSIYNRGDNKAMPPYQEIDTPTLVAGHKETIAALVCGGSGSKNLFNMVAHGTGWDISPEITYSKYFSKAEQIRLYEFARRTYYNTGPDFERVLPLTYNLISSLTYFSEIELVKPVAYLAPLVNIQGRKRLYQKQ